MSKPIVMERGVKYRDADKMALIPVKKRGNRARSPAAQAGMDENQASSGLYTYPVASKPQCAKNGLHSVCEEASCPNSGGMLQPRHSNVYDPSALFVPAVVRSVMLPTVAR